MKHLKRLIILSIVIFLLFLFLKDLDFGKVMKQIAGVNPIYPLLFLVGLYLEYFLRAYRWGLLLKPYKKNISLWTLYSYTVIGFLINTILPGKVGEAARGILLAQEEKISRSYGLATVVMERLIDFLVIIILFWGSLFFISVEQSPFLSKLKQISFWMFPFVILMIGFFYYLNSNKMSAPLERMIRKFSRLLPERLRERAVSSGVRFVNGLKLNLSFFDTIKLTVFSLLVWMALLPCYWIMMKAFHPGKVAQISLLDSVPFFSAIVISASIPSPGMAGSFDVASQQTLVNLYNVHPDQANAYTILVHFLILLIMIVPGLIAFWQKGITLDTIRNIRRKDKTPPGENSGNNQEANQLPTVTPEIVN